MLDEERLLRAILADPEAEAPRRAYANALAAVGETQRSLFIHVQLDMEQVGGDFVRWSELSRREHDLLESNRAEWEKPLRSLLRPAPSRPVKWLHAQLFGRGGTWFFRRGFVEDILAPAPKFLDEDIALMDHTPIRQVFLSQASAYVGLLAQEPRLQRLKALYLIGDMELDEDLERLQRAAQEAGLLTLEFKIPRLQHEVVDLFAILRNDQTTNPDSPTDPEEYLQWRLATPEAQERIRSLAHSAKWIQRMTQGHPAGASELLALNEWVYLGDRLKMAGVWAVAKGYHDLPDEQGLSSRIALFPKSAQDSPEMAKLKEVGYFQKS